MLCCIFNKVLLWVYGCAETPVFNYTGERCQSVAHTYIRMGRVTALVALPRLPEALLWLAVAYCFCVPHLSSARFVILISIR
jgi:hypothetical protein